MEVTAQTGKLKGVFLVRDKDGNPKFDDWNNIPKEYWNTLSEQDWAYIETKRGK